ncbi:hypothetical protein GALL_461280 [mine drainage metagenome]|uniref:Uncharacterized protein n=1 Tax=mine drainage metagenome TaxID=410659 RepID=A0A1J5PN64_9ZZZZ
MLRQDETGRISARLESHFNQLRGQFGKRRCTLVGPDRQIGERTFHSAAQLIQPRNVIPQGDDLRAQDDFRPAGLCLCDRFRLAIACHF